MSSITDRSNGDSDGDTETSPDATPKTQHSMSIVYIDHNLDKPIAELADDEVFKNAARTNLTVVYIDHHLDGYVSSDTGVLTQNQHGLFRLPPELRFMIWELLLPGRRLLRGRAWYERDRAIHPDDGSSNVKGCQGRWYFRVYKWEIDEFEDHRYLRSRIPTGLKICRESRQISLRHGSFVFGQRNNARETGTWWNPDLDVLGFDRSWDLDQHQWALANLHGLEHVKRVAIDERQAWTVCYKAGYNGSHPLDIPRKLREPLAVAFEFRGHYDRKHYILEFFPHFQQLKIIFSTIYNQKLTEAIRRRPVSVNWDSIAEDAYSVTFDLGSDIQTAVKELKRYRKLCMKTRVQEPDEDQYDALVEGPVYSVKHDGIDVDDLDYWMGAGFGMCQSDQDVPI